MFVDCLIACLISNAWMIGNSIFSEIYHIGIHVFYALIYIYISRRVEKREIVWKHDADYINTVQFVQITHSQQA